jgi:thymidylate synthase
MQSFDAASADEAWRLAVDAIKGGTHVLRQNGRGGYTSELLHVTIHVHDSRQRWVISRTPALSVAFAVVEVIGILNGRCDSAYLNFFNPSLPTFAGTGAEYHGAYGFRLRSGTGFDQLERASNALRANGDGRQVVLQIWNPALDFPSDDGTPVADDIPCNICSMLKVRNGRLEWSQIMRSNDIFLGLPHNFVQFTTLQEVLAGWIGVEPGMYTHFADSLHLYEKDAENVFSSAEVPVVATSDSLALSKHEADPIWREMNRRVDELVEKEHTPKEYGTIARLDDAPQAFGNLMAVVAADAARRRKCIKGVYEAIAFCESPLLIQLWGRWAERRGLHQSGAQVKDVRKDVRA